MLYLFSVDDYIIKAFHSFITANNFSLKGRIRNIILLAVSNNAEQELIVSHKVLYLEKANWNNQQQTLCVMCSHIYSRGWLLGYHMEASFKDALCSKKGTLSAGWPGVYPWHPDKRGTPPVMGMRNTNTAYKTSTSAWADTTDPFKRRWSVIKSNTTWLTTAVMHQNTFGSIWSSKG